MKINSEKSFVILSTVICFGFAIYFYSIIVVEYEVRTKGKLVNVQVTYIPNLCKNGARLQFRFLYKGKVHKLRIDKEVCNCKEGDWYKLYHNEKYEDVFVLPSNSMKYDFLYIIFFIVFGILCFVAFFFVSGEDPVF